jgi:phosphatidylserine/phosphatidylglycerophosphate/cardiolipin synthase-like enzyme
VLINGSFNWTRGAATTNCENLAILNAKPLVHAYQQEFDRLWAAFSR